MYSTNTSAGTQLSPRATQWELALYPLGLVGIAGGELKH